MGKQRQTVVLSRELFRLSAQFGDAKFVERDSWSERRAATPRKCLERLDRAPGLFRSSGCVSGMAGAPQQPKARVNSSVHSSIVLTLSHTKFQSRAISCSDLKK
ncbi:hypothetical protein WN51_05468 [Melipona quadrifasciata]|uniref:Uncharacterized protein n=1 Tax=Melipona quadrifasciata TaxID=166423 RepID=A0A0M9ACR3_9HYME|nr:hypothetical protein WN51_05468 [Melipona quadrifasciata]